MGQGECREAGEGDPIPTVGGLFSGIGGLELGLERAGFTTIWQSEINPYACKVLSHHWPTVPNLGDICDIDWSTVERPDLVCGGFPCQDISSAHTRGGASRSGLTGAKSGLWYQFARCLLTLQPEWAVVENVANGWKRWLPDVRSNLHSLGYTAVPVEVSAAAFGAPHSRRRIFIIAHADSYGESALPVYAKASELCAATRAAGYWGTTSPWVLGMDDGVPAGLDRCRVVGNAVVPQIAEWIGRLILAD